MSDFIDEKLEINELVARAQKVVAPAIEPARQLVANIKSQIAHGTDRITLSQLHEWGLALSIISAEMTPQAEAYALTSALWKSSISKTKATTVAARRLEKKPVADAENEAMVLNADKEVQKTILEYMTSLLEDTKKDIYTMCSELNRVMDARTKNNEFSKG